MKIYGICPLCGEETEIKNLMANYQMCSKCNKIYGLSNLAKIQGTDITQTEKEELKRKSQELMSSFIDSWKGFY